MDQRYKEIRLGEKGAWISLACYVCLALFKMITGYWTGSKALIADGLNNSTDILASAAVLIGLRISRKPPDDDHQYGHFRAETIGALIASFIMAMVGIDVLIEILQSWFATKPLPPNPLAAGVACISAAITYSVYKYNKNLATCINNKALMAAAKDNLSDTWVSLGSAVGILASQLGLGWLDAFTAIVISFLICKTAWEIFWDACQNLTDGFDTDKLILLREMVESIHGVEKVEDIKARNHGSQILVDLAIQVDPNMNVIESHHITEEIEQKMLQGHNIMNVQVHVEPKTE